MAAITVRVAKCKGNPDGLLRIEEEHFNPEIHSKIDVEATVDEATVDETTGVEMTRDELKAALDAAGVEYSARARDETLRALVGDI